jgi:NAD/NADP transhydrogenase alpha subunit
VKVGVPKETAENERRVALVPEVVKRLAANEIGVVVESGAGAGALLPDELFTEAGAEIGDPWSADVVAKVAVPTADEIGRLGTDSVLIGFLQPLTQPELAQKLADAGVTAFAMESIPRITRAQAMDALSSQANVGGYRAALLAATHLQRFFPMLMTAAGTIRPANVLVLGAGVAGLQAIATARRLGAQVTGYDVRPEVAEQVQSLGAKFLDVGVDAAGEGGYARELTEEERAKQQQGLQDAIASFDAVITTADPRHRERGRVDEARQRRHRHGRRVGRQLRADPAGPDRHRARRDDRLAGQPAVGDGRARLAALRAQRPVAARAHGRRGRAAQPRLRGRDHRRRLRDPEEGARRVSLLVAAAETASEGGVPVIIEIAIVVLSGFLGFQLISKVPNTLHTPLMSGTNAIHGIVLLGGLLVIGVATGFVNDLILVIAIVFGTINVVGGFLVTDRMLEMFKKKD